ncbi:Hsp20/alpha crystallin family protein [Aliifodinibius sp. S!AR15-10]|uniref:Hsp20/alpha crystallin family protein n=1 Tax=Aliifodinibius sp. S!AR15-10 TaxID=2950437 RepID=UPI0028638E2F|nr:Hsp20/alpha crystallin family protein [Aliifodinibius sp. S!AR15-10]MDR8393253.1 Hsp20/alpha crystallin family protein [Aliifodinibius sp. S!AR15-10]
MRSLVKRPETSPIDELRREMDHLFDEMVPFSWLREREGNNFDVWAPNTDMVETDDEYVIKVDLPGIPKEDVNINFKDNRLTISGERKKESKEEKENYMRRERYHGSFLRSFTLPNAVKEDDIKAKYRDGVLTINVKKAEESKPKKVKIE